MSQHTQSLDQAAQTMGARISSLQTQFGQDLARYEWQQHSLQCLDGHIFEGSDLLHAQLVAHKHSLKSLLATWGLPYPAGISLHITDDPDDAEDDRITTAARDFMEPARNYALKPATRSQGSAISLHIHTTDDLLDHLDSWRNQYTDWVLEDLCTGHDLKLLVLKGQIISAITLSPLFLTGNGSLSLEELIAQHNAALTPDQTIQMNAEVRQLLRDQNLYLGEVVAEGRQVRLSNAGTQNGGTQLLSLLHPDYAAMAQTLAQHIHAPLLGVNLITADHSQPLQGHARLTSMSATPAWLDYCIETEAIPVATRILSRLLHSEDSLLPQDDA